MPYCAAAAQPQTPAAIARDGRERQIRALRSPGAPAGVGSVPSRFDRRGSAITAREYRADQEPDKEAASQQAAPRTERALCAPF